MMFEYLKLRSMSSIINFKANQSSPGSVLLQDSTLEVQLTMLLALKQFARQVFERLVTSVNRK